MRKSTPTGWILGVVASGLALTAAVALPGLGTGVAAHKAGGVASADFWNKAGDVDHESHALSALSTVYEGPTVQNFLDYIKQADKLPQTGHAWENVGPFGGVVDVPGQGSGDENLGPVDGIGTAIAVDPSDSTGNTAYLGTIGGLYETTDGGKTVHDIIGNQLARDSIGAIAVDPADPSRVFAGTGVSIFTLSDDAAGAGMYVGEVKGGHWTWTRSNSTMQGYGVNSIAVSPDGTVYAGTTYGLWVSRDHGADFTYAPLPDNADHTGPAPLPMGSWVTSAVVNPQKPNEVTVAVGYAFGAKKYPDGEVIAPGNGLYRSTDGGRTFSFLSSTQQLTWAGASSDPFGRTSLAYSTVPGNPGLMWALVADAGKAAGNHTCVDTPAIPVCLDGNSVLNGVYRSTDDGATWQLEGTPQMLATAEGGTTSLAGNAIDYGPGVQGQYNNWIQADPTDPNRVYIGLEEAFTGEVHDATGALPVPTTTWATIEKYADVCGFLSYFNTIPNSNGVACPSQLPEYGGTTTHPDQHSAAFAVTPNGYRLYAGNDGGWWVQDAHAVSDVTAPQYQGFDSNSWTSLGKPATVLPWDVTRLQDGSYLLALQDNGVAHVTQPDGSAHQVCGGDGVYVFPGENASSYYCGIDGQQILATTDDFKHTTSVTPLNNASGATFLSPWTVDPTDPNHLLAAAENVDETDAGPNSNTYDPTDEVLLSSTWQTVFTPTPPKTGNWDSSAVYAQGPVDYVAFCSPCRPSLATGSAANAGSVTDLIATNVKPDCKATIGSGDCWHPAASTGLPHEQVSGIAVDPANPETVYVSLRQFIVMGADPRDTGAEKVMVSYDGGETFQNLSGNLPGADAHRIVFRDGQLYVATDVGIFTAPAGSTTWSRFDKGLPAVTYRSMKLDPTGRYLVAGAYGRGGWVYDFGPEQKPGHENAATLAAGSSTAPQASASGDSKPARAHLASASAADQAGRGGTLAFTGWNAVVAIAAALMLLASGTGLVMQARRRRQGGGLA